MTWVKEEMTYNYKELNSWTVRYCIQLISGQYYKLDITLRRWKVTHTTDVQGEYLVMKGVAAPVIMTGKEGISSRI